MANNTEYRRSVNILHRLALKLPCGIESEVPKMRGLGEEFTTRQLMLMCVGCCFVLTLDIRTLKVLSITRNANGSNAVPQESSAPSEQRLSMAAATYFGRFAHDFLTVPPFPSLTSLTLDLRRRCLVLSEEVWSLRKFYLNLCFSVKVVSGTLSFTN
jgi:hypothetical protein